MRSKVIIVLFAVFFSTFAIAQEDSGVLLNGALDITYVGHLEKTDDDGRLLFWEGSVGGDFAGKIRWWFIDPPAYCQRYVQGRYSELLQGEMGNLGK